MEHIALQNPSFLSYRLECMSMIVVNIIPLNEKANDEQRNEKDKACYY